MQTLAPACTPRDSIFDPSRRDTVLDLTDLIRDRIDPAAFFGENYVTEGMRILLTEAFRRLEGISTQGVFELTQEMGGGKTHLLNALGLLARYPDYRRLVMGDFYTPGDIGPVRVVAFTGRESDAPLGIWGSIATQLGKKEQFADYYSPLSAPGQTAWVNLLRGDPLIIMLDELPPYLQQAKSKTIGNSDLSVVTATALANLLVAIGRDELSNVCLVMTDLTASYAEGNEQIVQALNDLKKETGRTALRLQPVRMNTDEFFHILRQRIFAQLPPPEVIEEVAQGYAKAIRDARQMDVTNASPEQVAARIKESYPFHPSIRDLYARFKENPGFQQTRGLIRLMRIVAARLWGSGQAANLYLLTAQDIDLNDRETLSEINQINSSLDNAVSHDIASGGQSVAEILDTNLGGSDAQDAMKLLLVASLSTVAGAAKGLTLPELVANLCAPGRDISKLKNEVLNRLVTTAWYLHTGRDGRLFVKNVQNLVARLRTTAESYLHDQSVKELRERLGELFKPENGWCYQKVQVLPAVDEIDIAQDKTVLVVANPHPGGLHPDLQTLYDNIDFKNRVCFLTGQRSADSLLNAAKELKAIRHIIDELKSEGTPDNDPQLVQARDLLDRIQNQFGSALRETFSTLHYPSAQRLMSADFPMEFTANRYDGEDQVIRTLKAKMKYTDDVTGETFVKKVEARLFTQKAMPWNEIKRRAATNPAWQWHRADALERLKAECVHQDIWREDGGYVEKGPFPQPATQVKLQELLRDDDTGRVKLRATPLNGDSIYVEIGAPATTASQRLSGRDYETAEMVVSFLAVDSTGQHETGEPLTWHNRITIKSRVYDHGAEKVVELRTAPPAPLRYTTDGSDPKLAGGAYNEPVVLPAGTRFVLAVAEDKGTPSEVHQVAVNWDRPIDTKPIDITAPSTWRPVSHPEKVFRFNTTQAAYGFIERLKKHAGKAAAQRIAVLDGRWADLQLADDLLLDSEQIHATVEHLRGLVSEGEVTIEAAALWFPTGQQLLDYVHEIAVELPRDEVEP
ncbi:MAG: DUF499 domain-containing protein [Thiocapsa sp.]|uniref:DUF499 domain-containing protein n=1 Tax=Thiocapsa sp. TaxID=2024551 RepID=UPI001BD0949D|nr:DUF499 domain-containing protein [Thiocapsa sp.]QVL47709.1 MAG: DUF499 domain-containing protein [Thiocapsa sp.]